MAVKLTKNEQKKQKDQLKQFQRYLPTLQLKKSQLQSVIREVLAEMEELRRKQDEAIKGLDSWLAVYGENALFSPEKSIDTLIKVKEVKKTYSNVAGVTVPVFDSLSFEDIRYSLDEYPLWVDGAIFSLCDIAKYDALISTLKEEVRLLENELRVTSQRVNLFEKVKIPEAKENIRVIGIYLQDQQTQAVVRGKIAKRKLTKVG